MSYKYGIKNTQLTPKVRMARSGLRAVGAVSWIKSKAYYMVALEGDSGCCGNTLIQYQERTAKPGSCLFIVGSVSQFKWKTRKWT